VAKLCFTALYLLTELYLLGLAEAGFISSKLSNHDLLSSSVENQGPFYFAAER
jgi:hypothetical protein